LKDLTKTNLLLQTHSQINEVSEVVSSMKSVLSNPDFLANNIDYASKFLKAFYSKIKVIQLRYGNENPHPLLIDFAQFLTQTVLKDILDKDDEHYCKIL